MAFENLGILNMSARYREIYKKSEWNLVSW